MTSAQVHFQVKHDPRIYRSFWIKHLDLLVRRRSHSCRRSNRVRTIPARVSRPTETRERSRRLEYATRAAGKGVEKCRWCGCVPAWAAPEHGLIENRTLPLTQPLQVKTDPGRDYHLVMRKAETTEIAVTAYIEGGRFFRLLMPPNTYTRHAAIGREWRGEED